MTLSHIFLIIFLFSSAIATNISAKYKVTFGIFGEIGIAKTNLHVDDKNHYIIKLHAKTTGMANFLSGNREEWFVSSGKVDEQGILIPDYYEKIVQRQTRANTSDDSLIIKKDIKRYTFSHDKKEMKMETTKHRGESVGYQTRKGDYYAPNDLLSLFFNLKNMLVSLEIKEPAKFYAVGANKTDGRIDVVPLKDPERIKKEFDWDDGHMMKVVINQKIFSSDKGELLVNLGDNGLCKQAVLKDVLFFGDIRGELID